MESEQQKATPMIWALDYEGTRKTGVVEYGLVGIRDGKIAEVHTRLCHPRAPLDPREATLTGLLNAQALASAAPFEEERALLLRARRSGALAAHNANYEDMLTRATWPLPAQVSDFSRPYIHSVSTWAPWIDSRLLAKRAWPDLESYSLGDLVASTGLQTILDDLARRLCPPDRIQYHAALYDAIACAVVILAALDRIGVTPNDLPAVYAAMAHGTSQQPDLFE